MFDTQTGFWDHPREYGENRVSAMHTLLTLGSSPRIRGELTMRP